MKWFKSTYIGTVSAYTDYHDGDTFSHRVAGRWVLTMNWIGRRKAKMTGDVGKSPLAMDRRARVEAWLQGGPVPELDEDTQPRKEAPVLKIVR